MNVVMQNAHISILMIMMIMMVMMLGLMLRAVIFSFRLLDHCHASSSSSSSSSRTYFISNYITFLFISHNFHLFTLTINISIRYLHQHLQQCLCARTRAHTKWNYLNLSKRTKKKEQHIIYGVQARAFIRVLCNVHAYSQSKDNPKMKQTHQLQRASLKYLNICFRNEIF